MLYCAGFYNGFNIAGCQGQEEEPYNADEVGPFRMQSKLALRFISSLRTFLIGFGFYDG